MPRTYSNVECADMIFVYGFCDDNALLLFTEAARIYTSISKQKNAELASHYNDYF